jgi:hypothetical protein
MADQPSCCGVGRAGGWPVITRNPSDVVARNLRARGEHIRLHTLTLRRTVSENATRPHACVRQPMRAQQCAAPADGVPTGWSVIDRRPPTDARFAVKPVNYTVTGQSGSIAGQNDNETCSDTDSVANFRFVHIRSLRRRSAGAGYRLPAALPAGDVRCSAVKLVRKILWHSR